jgi:hypothetical protein
MPAPKQRPDELEVNLPADALAEDRPRPARNPAGGGFSPTEDGGNPQHPVHDEDQEDRTPGDYEREIDRLDAAINNRIG